MSELTAGSTLIPSLRYRDAYGAIEWLERAFGFVRTPFSQGRTTPCRTPNCVMAAAA